ncbi:MAG TPA: DUF4038 domain-containing protein [Pirellulales bacterium]|nr:DUF4038 domain-containing protein [Pirellulales bacterium]
MKRIMTSAVLVGCLVLASRIHADQPASVPSVQANKTLELTFVSKKAYSDPFNDVELDVVVTAPSGEPARVPAFWAGGQTWKLRFASPSVGEYRYRTECSDAANAALHAKEGHFKIIAYEGDNPLYRHGPLRVASDRRHFEHADGTPFLWLADTWWMGLCERLRWPDEFQLLAADRRDKGFNVVQIVAGLYPDMPAFDERGRNEAGFPWETDYSRIRPEYFDLADRRINQLVESGLTPCIVGAWGYHLPWMGVPRLKQHWRNLVARYGSLPVVWCIAGEGEMPYYLAKDKEKDKAAQRAGWSDIAAYVRKIDPYNHLITIHPVASARQTVENPAVLDFDMLQTGHGDRASIPNTLKLVRASRAAWPTMPTVNGEVCYEGILDTCYEDVQRYMVWSCLLSGNTGHTYGANGIWQLNREEKAYGKSPHGGTWGATPWNVAMKLPGSRQVGLAKRLLESLPWTEFEPHPNWASAVLTPPRPWEYRQWIWYPEGKPAQDAPAGTRYFRKTFELVADKSPSSAELRVTADDKLTVFINGHKLPPHAGWNVIRRYTDIGQYLRAGKNVVAVRAENGRGPANANPAGLLCRLQVESADGKRIVLDSDPSWRTSQAETEDWTKPGFDDSGWKQAAVAAAYGSGPWGKLREADEEFSSPFASGIAAQVRVIYSPTASAIQVHDLEPNLAYAATAFDPATGEKHSLGLARGDSKGNWTAAPSASQHDWVLLLEAKADAPPRLPIAIHPQNPKYFLFRDRPLVLIAASEHYGAVVNRAFDFERYLKDAADKKQTMTRTFLLFREQQSSRNPSSPIKPESPDYLTPYPRVGPGKAMDGEPLYDLDQWNPEYFSRLKAFLARASELGIVVELTLFSNTYADGVWALNPLRAANNIQHVGEVGWQDYTSLKNRQLNERQFALVEKIVRETSQFDNVYYEICNEPGGGMPEHATPADVDQWQQEVARVVRAQLKRLGRTHLVFASQAFSYTPKFTQELDASFAGSWCDAVNVHPLPNTILGGRAYMMGNFMSKELALDEVAAFCRKAQSYNKPFVMDEDNAASLYRDPTGWTIHRKRAWVSAMSQGHYDFIDFSVTVGSETGTAASSAQIRTWMKHLSEFIHSLDVIHAQPLADFVHEKPQELLAVTLALPGKSYVCYLADRREVTDPRYGEAISGELKFELPAGEYRARFYSPRSGERSPAVRVKGPASDVTLELPPFEHDIVLMVERAE